MPFLIGFLGRFFLRLFAGSGKFLLGFLAPLIAPLMTFLGGFFKKLGILALVVAAIALAINVLSVAISAMLSGLTGGLPDDLLVIGRMLIPSNIPYCLSLLVVARVKSLVFYWVSKLSEKLIHT